MVDEPSPQWGNEIKITGELSEAMKRAQENLHHAIFLDTERMQDQLLDHLFRPTVTGFGMATLKREGTATPYISGWKAYMMDQRIKRTLYRTTPHVVSLKHRSPWRYALAVRFTRARHWLADRVIDITEQHIGGPTYDREY